MDRFEKLTRQIFNIPPFLPITEFGVRADAVMEALRTTDSTAREECAQRVDDYSGDGKFCDEREANLCAHLSAAIRGSKP